MFTQIIYDIIIVNYNSTQYAIQCIESIYRIAKNRNVNVIVVDNASTDMPKEIMNRFPRIQYHENNKNLGFAKGVNLAARKTSAKFILLINPDAILLDGFFDSIYDYIADNENVAVLGPKIFEQNGDIQGSARKFPTALTSLFGRKSPLTKLFPNNIITKKEFMCFHDNGKDAVDVDWVSGACMIIKREAFEAIGGFDESFFLYWEDADLCKRLKDRGWRIKYYHRAAVMHSVGMSSNTRPIASICHFHYSCYKYFVKHARGIQKMFKPISILGLSLRCLFVILLNILKQKYEVRNKQIDNKNQCRTKSFKILRVISRLNIGGPAIHVALLSKGLNENLFESKVVAGSRSPFEGDMNYLLSRKNGNYYNIPELQREIAPLRDIKSFVKLFLIILRENPDIVHTHMAKAGALARIAVWIINTLMKTDIKTVHTYHGNVLEGYFSKTKSITFKWIERVLALMSDAIIAISRTQKWELSEKYRICRPNKVHTIPLGFDLSKFVNARNYRGEIRKKIGANDDIYLIGIVGRLTAIKNHYMFIDVAKILIDRCKTIPLKFIIIGDGELHQCLKEYAKSLGLQENIIFYGWERDIQKVYADLDILALTSMNEGTPVSIIEAMASEVPVITTGVGGVKDLLGDFDPDQNRCQGFMLCERGILCPKNEPTIFADGIEYLINNGVDRKHAMVKKARVHVLNNYSESKLISNIESLYLQLLRSV